MARPDPARRDLGAAFARLAPGRRVHGISAVLLPYTADGTIDRAAFERHLLRTRAAGLDVAVNMDTGFVDLLTPDERTAIASGTAAFTRRAASSRRATPTSGSSGGA